MSTPDNGVSSGVSSPIRPSNSSGPANAVSSLSDAPRYTFNRKRLLQRIILEDSMSRELGTCLVFLASFISLLLVLQLSGPPSGTPRLHESIASAFSFNQARAVRSEEDFWQYVSAFDQSSRLYSPASNNYLPDQLRTAPLPAAGLQFPPAMPLLSDAAPVFTANWSLAVWLQTTNANTTVMRKASRVADDLTVVCWRIGLDGLTFGSHFGADVSASNPLGAIHNKVFNATAEDLASIYTTPPTTEPPTTTTTTQDRSPAVGDAPAMAEDMPVAPQLNAAGSTGNVEMFPDAPDIRSYATAKAAYVIAPGFARLNSAGNQFDSKLARLMADGKWHHFALVVEGGQTGQFAEGGMATFYHDGVPTQPVKLDKPFADCLTGDVTVGDSSRSGGMAGLVVYPRALQSNEISDIIASGSTLDEIVAGTTAYSSVNGGAGAASERSAVADATAASVSALQQTQALLNTQLYAALYRQGKSMNETFSGKLTAIERLVDAVLQEQRSAAVLQEQRSAAVLQEQRSAAVPKVEGARRQSDAKGIAGAGTDKHADAWRAFHRRLQSYNSGLTDTPSIDRMMAEKGSGTYEPPYRITDVVALARTADGPPAAHVRSVCPDGKPTQAFSTMLQGLCFDSAGWTDFAGRDCSFYAEPFRCQAVGDADVFANCPVACQLCYARYARPTFDCHDVDGSGYWTFEEFSASWYWLTGQALNKEAFVASVNVAERMLSWQPNTMPGVPFELVASAMELQDAFIQAFTRVVGSPVAPMGTKEVQRFDTPWNLTKLAASLAAREDAADTAIPGQKDLPPSGFAASAWVREFDYQWLLRLAMPNSAPYPDSNARLFPLMRETTCFGFGLDGAVVGEESAGNRVEYEMPFRLRYIIRRAPAQWHHMGVSLNATHMTFFVDGQSESVCMREFSYWPGCMNGNVMLGEQLFSGIPPEGLMFGLKVYPRQLSLQEAQRDFYSGLNPYASFIDPDSVFHPLEPAEQCELDNAFTVSAAAPPTQSRSTTTTQSPPAKDSDSGDSEEPDESLTAMSWITQLVGPASPLTAQPVDVLPYMREPVALIPPVVLQWRSPFVDCGAISQLGEKDRGIYTMAQTAVASQFVKRCTTAYNCTFPVKAPSSPLLEGTNYQCVDRDKSETAKHFGRQGQGFSGWNVYAEFVASLLAGKCSRDGQLRDTRRWIDAQTTKVQLGTFLFVPQQRALSLVTVEFEFDGNGVTGGNPSMQSLYKMSDRDAYNLLVASGILFVLSLANLFLVVRSMLCSPAGRVKCKQRLKTSILSCGVPVLGVLCAVYNMFVIRAIQDNLAAEGGELSLLFGIPWADPALTYDAKFKMLLEASDKVLQQSEFFQIWKAVCFAYAYVSFVQLTLYLRFHPRTAMLIDTIALAMNDLVHFALTFSAFFFTLAFLSSWMFGAEMTEFATFGTAVWTQINMLLGNFPTLPDRPGALVNGLLCDNALLLYYVYLMTFVVVVFFILVNFFLAIILDTFKVVSERSRACEVEFSVLCDAASLLVFDLLRLCHGWPERWRVVLVLAGYVKEARGEEKAAQRLYGKLIKRMHKESMKALADSNGRSSECKLRASLASSERTTTYRGSQHATPSTASAASGKPSPDGVIASPQSGVSPQAGLLADSSPVTFRVLQRSGLFQSDKSRFAGEARAVASYMGFYSIWFPVLLDPAVFEEPAAGVSPQRIGGFSSRVYRLAHSVFCTIVGGPNSSVHSSNIPAPGGNQKGSDDSDSDDDAPFPPILVRNHRVAVADSQAVAASSSSTINGVRRRSLQKSGSRDSVGRATATVDRTDSSSSVQGDATPLLGGEHSAHERGQRIRFRSPANRDRRGADESADFYDRIRADFLSQATLHSTVSANDRNPTLPVSPVQAAAGRTVFGQPSHEATHGAAASGSPWASGQSPTSRSVAIRVDATPTGHVAMDSPHGAPAWAVHSATTTPQGQRVIGSPRMRQRATVGASSDSISAAGQPGDSESGTADWPCLTTTPRHGDECNGGAPPLKDADSPVADGNRR